MPSSPAFSGGDAVSVDFERRIEGVNKVRIAQAGEQRQSFTAHAHPLEFEACPQLQVKALIRFAATEVPRPTGAGSDLSDMSIFRARSSVGLDGTRWLRPQRSAAKLTFLAQHGFVGLERIGAIYHGCNYIRLQPGSSGTWRLAASVRIARTINSTTRSSRCWARKNDMLRVRWDRVRVRARR